MRVLRAEQLTKSAIAAAVCLACDSILGISSPTLRDESGGQAGRAGSEASGGDGNRSGAGGSGGGAGQLSGGGGGPSGGSLQSGGASSGGVWTGTGGAPAGGGGDAGEGGASVTGGTANAGDGPVAQGGTAGVAGAGRSSGGVAGSPGCESGQSMCRNGSSLTCVDGEWHEERCRAYCQNGGCVNPPSCSGDLRCGSNDSCCRSLEVPAGQYLRSYDGVTFTDDRNHANISAFLLDRFEVSLGRLRNFVAGYPENKPKPGDGKSPHIAADSGWSATFALPETRADLIAALHCSDTTWTDNATGDERLPATCANFYVAYAFCIWDGGRLPTEAEWNYAAAGGEQQRAYPWSSPPDSITIDAGYAVYDRLPSMLPEPVGSRSASGSHPASGDGRWGHADLAGNLSEWVLDYYLEDYPSSQCDDCLNAKGAGFVARVVRGGSYADPAEGLFVSLRSYIAPSAIGFGTGFRCARDIDTHP